jgi:TonB family protein
MIMMTKNQTRFHAILRLLMVIPLSAALIIAAASCSGSKKAAKTQKEMAPPPPPPAPSMQDVPSEVFVVVEEMPVFPGGDEALRKFVSDNVKFPEQAKVKNITGRVILRFCVKYDGTIDKVQVLKSVDPLLDAEAIRVVKMLPKWQPGKQGGKPVNVWYSMPVVFGLLSEGKNSMQSFSQPRYMLKGTDTIYLTVTEKPIFIGGSYALYKFKRDNLKYPDAAKSNNLGGTVNVQFIVNENGSLSDLSISSGISPSLDAEVLRVAKLMPAWKPGKENGRPVKVRITTFFNFDIPSLGPSQEAANEVFVVVEEMPIFPGGDSTLIKFIAGNIQYPKNAKEKNIQGRVILRFCVTSEGKIAKVGVLKGVDQELDFEAIRVIKTLPEWQPGMQGGKPVNVWYAVPITFKLSGPDQPKTPQTQIAPPPPPPPLPLPSLPSGYDEAPVYIGSESALFKFLQTKMVYPQAAKEKGITGKVVISFSISETGLVDNVNIRESVDPLLDAEALRVVRLIPAWQPGKFKGAPVKVSYSMPINFSLK